MEGENDGGNRKKENYAKINDRCRNKQFYLLLSNSTRDSLCAFFVSPQKNLKFHVLPIEVHGPNNNFSLYSVRSR